MRRYGNWIGGAEVDPGQGSWLPSTRPGTSELVCEIAAGDGTDIDLAARSAAAAFSEWRTWKPADRGQLLARIAASLREEQESLAALETAESGKPVWQTRLEVEGSAAYFDFYAGCIRSAPGELVDMGTGYHAYTRREPYGLVGLITPWNVALNQAARGVAPGLATGNVMVVKPSEFTSATTLELARIASAAGTPEGVLNVVTGTGPAAGQALVEHPLVRKLAFTGSVTTGRAVGRIAAERILPLTLELGGKSPHLIFEDADLDLAAHDAVRAVMANAGQTCSAGSRVLVADTVHDEFVERLAAAAGELTPGESFGPQITRGQFEKVISYFQVADKDGATLLTGGEPTGDGWLVQPTIYVDVDQGMRIAREEIFGPVMCVLRFHDEEEAVAMANDSEYGLAAGVWTADIARAHRVAARLEAGQVYVNAWQSGLVEGPFGGHKSSGYGREKGLEALLHYTHTKFVSVKL